jgi:hypothetical protein
VRRCWRTVVTLGAPARAIQSKVGIDASAALIAINAGDRTMPWRNRKIARGKAEKTIEFR